MPESFATGGSLPERAPNEEESFEKKKRGFFIKIGLSVRDALRSHKEAGLLDWDEELDRSWRNVSEHCLVETARAEVLADKLGLPEDLKKDLIIAAALHDSFKKQEIKLLAAKGKTWDTILEAEEQGNKFLKKRAFNDRIIRIASFTGFDPSEKGEILEKENLSQEDLACLVLGYIDSYTHGSEWVEPPEETGGEKRDNALDRRVDSLKIRYKELDEDSKKRFSGKPVLDIYREIGHLVEKKIAEIWNQRNNSDIDSKNLPHLIDQEIRTKIESQD